MSRTLSPEFVGAAFAQETGEAIAVLLTITPPSGYVAPEGSGYSGGTIRISSHNTARSSTDPLRYATMSRGHRFDYYPFQITLPEEGEDAQPTMNIVLDNVEREVTVILASLTKPATVTVELVLASAPNDVEIEFPDFSLVSSIVTAEQAVLQLSLETVANEPYPGWEFTPGPFGGLWASA